MPEDLFESMRRFRALHPCRAFSDGRFFWPFVAGGESSSGEAVLLLPGALGRGETSFQYIMALESRCRVIAPDYPRGADTIAALADGATALLGSQGINRAHIVGGSFGGLVAQGLLQRYPERVAGLILSDTLPPLPKRAARLRFSASLLSRLSDGAVRAGLSAGIRHYLHALPPDQKRFWHAHFGEHIARLTRADVLDRARAWIDFDEHYAVPANPRRNTLIVQAAADRLVRPTEHAALCALYPCAARKTIYGGGHAASLLRAEEYIGTVCTFLDGQRPEEGT